MNENGPRFRRSPVGAVVLTAVAAGLGVWLVLGSPLFDTRRIEVRGVHHLTRTDVIRAAGVQADESLVRLSLEEVSSAVEELPWVADAAAGRDLPSTLTIEVVERTAAGWVLDPGGMAVVARDGTILERTTDAPRRLPDLGPWPEPLEPGGQPVRGSIALRVTASMGSALLTRIAAVREVEDGVVLQLREGGEVRYGEPVRLSDKNGELGDLLAWARRADVDVATIDLRIPEAPTVLPVGGARPSPSPAA